MCAYTFAAVNKILDPDWLSQQCGRNVHAVKLRIKPDTSLLAALQQRHTNTTIGWARILWPNSHRKAAKTQQWADAHGFHVTTTPLSDTWVFQYGEILADPKLNAYIASANINGELGELKTQTILRYNPARRLVCTHNKRVTRISVAPHPTNIQLYSFLSQVVPTPQRLDNGENPNCSSFEYVGDRDLTKNAPLSATRSAGNILAQLHSATAQLPPTLAGRIGQSTPSFHTRMSAHAQIFSHLDPGLAARIETLAMRIPEFSTTDRVLTHGDASPDQFLISQDNTELWITDFDRITLQPPEADLGTYLANVDKAHHDELLAGYAEYRHVTPTTSALRNAQIRAQLLNIAAPLRSGIPNWHAAITEILNDVEELLL